MLDLFAGSGAVGLEAVSRGATEAVWVESDRRHVVILKQNVQAFGATGRVVGDDCLRWLRHAEHESFDLVFADPPYDWAIEHGFAGIAELLRSRNLVRTGGILVAEQPTELAAAELPQWELLRDRAYGHTRLVMYRLLNETGNWKLETGDLAR